MGRAKSRASGTTTERYDNQQLERLQVAAGKLESGKVFELGGRDSCPLAARRRRVAAHLKRCRTANRSRERSERWRRLAGRQGFEPR